jgi:hypothetical protein
MRNAYRVSVGKSEGKDYLGDLSADEKVILKRFLQKKVSRCGLDSSG